MRLKGKGLPKGETEFGDLYLSMIVEFPEESTDEEKALWEQLASVSQFNPRR